MRGTRIFGHSLWLSSHWGKIGRLGGPSKAAKIRGFAINRSFGCQIERIGCSCHSLQVRWPCCHAIATERESIRVWSGSPFTEKGGCNITQMASKLCIHSRSSVCLTTQACAQAPQSSDTSSRRRSSSDNLAQKESALQPASVCALRTRGSGADTVYDMTQVTCGLPVTPVLCKTAHVAIYHFSF